MELIWLLTALAVGIALGMSLQWRRDSKHIVELEQWQITLWHTIDTQAEYIDALEDDGDEDEEVTLLVLIDWYADADDFDAKCIAARDAAGEAADG